MSIHDVRRHLAADPNVFVLDSVGTVQAFEVGVGRDFVRIETCDDGVLVARDADGETSPELRVRVMMRLRQDGVDLDGVREPGEPNEMRSEASANRDDNSNLQARAIKALPRWVCREPMPGLYAALLPVGAVGLLSADEALVVARALAWNPIEAEAFVGRYVETCPGSDLAARFAARDTAEDPPTSQARKALEPALRALWPEWEGWAAPPPRKHVMEEYVLDLGTGQYWDAVLCRPVTDRALNGDIKTSDWPIIFVDGEEVRIKPSKWMANRDRGYVVDAVTRVPGEGRFVRDVYFDHTGRRYFPGMRLLNTWRPPPAVEANAPDAGPWLDLVERLFPNRAERERVLNSFAWVVQKKSDPLPGVLALIGPQGVGKDAVLLPLNYAVGYWNVASITPDELVGRFNPFIEADLLNINEVRLNHQEGGAHGFYSKIKSISTRPPDTIARDEKNVRVRYVPKTSSIFMTSNEGTGFYVPEDDRRYFMPTITLRERWHIDAGLPDYFVRYFGWLKRARGYAAIHKYLAERDLSQFDPTVPPPTSLTKKAAQAASAEGDSMLARGIEQLGSPDGFFEAELREMAKNDKSGVEDHELLLALRTARLVQRLEGLGYIHFPNPNVGKQWEFEGTNKDTRQKQRKRARKAYISKAALAVNSPEAIEQYLKARGKAWAEGAACPIEVPAQRGMSGV